MHQNPFDRIAAVDMTVIEGESGTLVVAEEDAAIPFKLRRVFFLRDLKPGISRGGHAHHQTEHVLVPVSGCFDLDLTDGVNSVKFNLHDPKRGVYVPSMIWDRLYNFTPGAICMVLASTLYDPSDYIYDWNEFLKAV